MATMVIKCILDLFKRKKDETKKSESISTSFSLSQYNVVAKWLTGPGIESMYDSKAEIPGKCPKCHSRLEMIPDLDYYVPKKKGDLFYTDDAYCIVSEKFKFFCESYNYAHLKFVKLNKCEYYYFEPIDLFRIYIHKYPFNQLGKYCDMCNTYDEVCGGVLKEKDYILTSDDFILRTDIYRGSYEYKGLDIIVGLQTERKMKEYGLKGLNFTNVYG